MIFSTSLTLFRGRMREYFQRIGDQASLTFGAEKSDELSIIVFAIFKSGVQ